MMTDTVTIDRELLAELIEIADNNTYDLYGKYKHDWQSRIRASDANIFETELATIARAKKELEK